MLTAEEHQARLLKIRRLRAGAAPRVLELCSGCGGLSLGLKSAGFQLTAHVEKDVEAAKSYALNFAPAAGKTAEWSIARDMEQCSPDELVQSLGLDTPTSGSFDIVAAGLPCQAFARIGRSKLRAVAGGEEDAFQKDARASLYLRFLEYVSDTQPLAIIVENVPDILNFGGRNVAEEICDTLESRGYRCSYTLLNSAYYGVPQVRERFFLVAIANDLSVTPAFPEPTHFLDLPRGYEGSRHVALKYVPHGSRRFQPLHTPEPELPPAVCTEEALDDLPIIKEHLSEPRVMGRRKVRDRLAYRTVEVSGYAQRMRDWKGFENMVDIDGNVVRLTPRDFRIFNRMPHGADYPVARKIAEQIFKEEMARRNWTDMDPESPEYVLLWKETVPPYDPGKFPNKWWKLDPAKPSRTLTAHMGKDTYSHIHYDSAQQRMVSVREAARLQSFPDGFRFAGEMNASFRQIGNAVPPLLGYAVARKLEEQLIEALDSYEQTGDQQAAA
jgi:DNA (cytosine-5)-methyltransferase 1